MRVGSPFLKLVLRALSRITKRQGAFVSPHFVLHKGKELVLHSILAAVMFQSCVFLIKLIGIRKSPSPIFRIVESIQGVDFVGRQFNIPELRIGCEQ